MIEPRQPTRLEKKANIADIVRRPAEARVSILLYDTLDFSTDRDDGGGQTRESLSWIASPSAAVARLDPARTETASFTPEQQHGGIEYNYEREEPMESHGNVPNRSRFAPDVPMKFARIGSV